ncbi:MAG: polyprenol monophosphomannose synthase [Candidatus Hodarchaeota archaeon]
MNVYIIIPTYNEAENIEPLVNKIFVLQPKFNIIIVDDNSPDGTGDIADNLSRKDNRIETIHRPRKAGLGTAYMEGFKQALAKGADYIFEMDADFSHDPNSLQSFVEAIKDADLVIGSRYVNGVRVIGWRFRRLFISKMANIFISHLMVNPEIYDYTAGYRCYRRKVIESIDLNNIYSDGYAFQIEMTYRTFQKGFKIIEIPIIFRERESGISKISRNVAWEAFWLTLKLRAPIKEIIKTLALSYKKYLLLD